MKAAFWFFISFLFAKCTFCQSSNTKNPALSMNFTLTDFSNINNVKDDISGEIHPKEAHMKSGLSLTYLNGINSHLDFIVNGGGCFIDYPFSSTSGFEKNNLFLELTTGLNWKLNTDKSVCTPYFTTGLSLSKYRGYIGMHIPAGAGIQVNYKDEIYLFIQSVYSFTVINKVRDYLQYSIGIAGNLKKKKLKEIQMLPQPMGLPTLNINKDQDGDGIIDSLDRCPNIPGIISLKGCPDKDSDGIADGDDKCPDTPGKEKYFGCPVPDSDGDGVNDEIDSCVNEAGPMSNGGCPVVIPSAENNILNLAKNILFVTNSAQFLPEAYKALDQVAEILKSNYRYTLEIRGHTDNTGNTKRNYILSQQRANAVAVYLKEKGISKERLLAIGFGETLPIADNSTNQGRAQNRRVEFKLNSQ